MLRDLIELCLREKTEKSEMFLNQLKVRQVYENADVVDSEEEEGLESGVEEMEAPTKKIDPKHSSVYPMFMALEAGNLMLSIQIAEACGKLDDYYLSKAEVDII